MYVVGATKSENLKSIRNIVPDSFLLIPGVGLREFKRSCSKWYKF